MASSAQPELGTESQNWPVRPSRGGLIGLVVAAVLLVIGIASLAAVVGQALSPLVFLLVGLGALGLGLGAAALVLATGYYRLRYELAAGELRVHSARTSERLSLDRIDGIYSGQQIGELRGLRGVSWPGYFVGTTRTRTHGALQLYCTDLGSEALSIVVAAERTLVLSPVDPPAFRRELIRRIEAGESSAAPRPVGASQPRRLPQALLAGLATAAVGLLLTAVAAVSLGFPLLPDRIVPFPESTGALSSPTSRDWLLSLPALGLAVLLVNAIAAFGLRKREPAGAVLLAGTTCLVQLLVLLGSLRVLA
jgi:hypothetical protein